MKLLTYVKYVMNIQRFLQVEGAFLLGANPMGKGIVIPFVKKKDEKEELTEKDWKELMGMDRDVYIKREGITKRKG